MDWNAKARLFRTRFYGRQDVYGKLWEIRKDGKEVRGYSPVCDNRWQDFCHLKNKSATPCSSCNHQKWTPVTDESVQMHITGEEVHIYYVLLPGGDITFGAIDFDMKEGKEDKGYGFEDVSRTSEILRNLGVSHHIARSTGRGYHLYIFFDRPYSATRFRSFILDIFDRAGFIELVQQNIKPLPEYFPKQSYTSQDGIGNGIKPPMIEPRFVAGRNGWVDENDRFIGEGLPDEQLIAAQWEYFSAIVPQSVEAFDKVITDNGIEIAEDVQTGAARATGGKSRSSSSSGKWQQPLSGAVEKVLEGCAALRRVRDKALNAEVLGHHEGFSLYHICIHTRDGRDWFDKHVPGWGESLSDERQLQQSVEKNYLPWSCKRLQQEGICPAGTQCFEKKPPREIVDGIEVLRSDLPKEQWPEPSPIRYAYGKGEDYLLKLQKEVLELKKEKDPDAKTEKLKSIASRLQVFDAAQQKDFKAFVREQKTLKRNEISKLFNEAAETYEEESKSALKTRDDMVVFDDNFYIKDDYGYTFIKSVKEGRTKHVKICSVDLWIEEIVTYHTGETNPEAKPKTVYKGIAKAPGIETNFAVDTDIWSDNSRFIAYFASLLRGRFSPIRQNIELIKQAALEFSYRRGINHSVRLMTQGYYGETYLMPGVIVDVNGIRPNTTQHVDLQGKETKSLDFQILPQSDLRDLLMHIKTDFLTTWPELWTYTGIAHTLLPGVMVPLEWAKRPTLFYEGLTGTGKSELTIMLQQFWGQFDAVANFMSSPKGVRELGYQFKDACLVVDDYKELSKEQRAAVRDTILHAYDGNVDYKLQRNSELRVGKPARCIYMMSGEDFITNDAAVIARTVLVEVGRQNTLKTAHKFEKVCQTKHLYSGITPQFISWFLKQDRKKTLDNAKTTKSRLKEGLHEAQNIERVAGNLAGNFIVWELFTRFLVDMGVASANEKEVMDAKHWEHIKFLRTSMLRRCMAEQGSEVFLSVLTQLMMSGEVYIKDLPGYMPDHKPIIGYIPKDQPDGGAIYLFPDITFETVKRFSQNQPLYGTKLSIGRQLDDQGHIATKDKDHFTKNIRSTAGRQVRVWALKPTALGLEEEFVMRLGVNPKDRDGKILEFRKAMSTTGEDYETS